jgi:phosphohistidine phosphatase
MAPRRGGQADLVVLVRHGKAEDDHPLGDGARPLSDDGREAFRAHARVLAGELSVQGILTSPLVRAVQTAEILADALGVSQVLVRGELDLDRASAPGLEALCRAVGPGWALVGHNPSLADTLARLVGRAGEPPRFRKGAAAALRMSDSGTLPWTLAWMAAPGRKPTTEVD